MLPALRSSMLAGGKKKPAYWGLCFTAVTPGSTVALMKNSATNTIYLQTSFDGKTWTPYADNQVITLAKAGDCVYFAAQDGRINQTIGDGVISANRARRFAINGKIAASGHLNSLQANDGSITTAYRYGFNYLFNGCTSLVSAPALPATTLEPYCYRHMFDGCTSLVSAPALPATTLANNCYRQMFGGCTSLVSAPALPATTLANNCYRQMFDGCTSLVSAPALPATTLANYCYQQMFNGCTSLKYVDVKFTTFSVVYTANWLSGVAASGVFRCPAALGTNDTIQRDVSYCPAGWTVENI